MDFKEGMRRLALVAGIVGACVGAYVSYLQIGSLVSQRTRHDSFLSLINTPAVQKDIQLLKTGLPEAKDPGYSFKDAHHGQDWFDAVAAVSGSTDGWAIGEGGGSKIYFSGNGQVNCIANS